MDKRGIITRARVMLASFVLKVVVGVADYATGYELNVDILYSVPVSISAWYLRRG